MNSRPSEAWSPGPDDARDVLREVWRDHGDLTRLPGEADVNFRVHAPDGTRSILKFAQSGTDPAEVDLQHAALAHLAPRSDARMRVPRGVPTAAGDRMVTVRDRVVHRLAWVEGPTLASVVPARLAPSLATDRFARWIGEFTGRLDAALSDFDHPAADRSHRWDPADGGWVADEIGVVSEPSRRRILARVVESWERSVPAHAERLPRTVVHGDANDHNLVVDADAWARGPVGLIDFGDMLRTARVVEPAVAAAYAAMRTIDPVETVALVAAGWLEAWDAGVARMGGDPTVGAPPRVSDEELAAVPVLVRMRLAISVVTSARRSVERPDDDYVTVSEAGAWRVLEALDGVDGDHAAGRVLAACGRAGRTSHSGGRGETPDGGEPAPLRSDGELASERSRLAGPSLSLSYRDPVHAVRGWMQWLYAADGTAYLDAYNNVPHVGHSHPRVADAVARQTSLLATNTRYLSQVRLDYMARLADRFPDPLDTVYLVNSASEANELALRIARAATGRRDLVVQQSGYHGHTTTLVDASPYKADGPGGEGTPEWAHTIAIPDTYRGRFRTGRDDDPGGRYAADVAELAGRLAQEGRAPGALLLETFPSVGGQIVPPDGYLEGAYRAIREVGGLVIADEVQTGLGRLGSVEWGFQTAPVVPDLVVLGKPIGNGFPLGAVVTSRALAEAFDTGMEFFSTFGGNPVACAAGGAVLDVLDDQALAANAERVGVRLLDGLRGVGDRHDRVGDVRGMGLFVGVEIVADRTDRAPDAGTARRAVEGLKARGILAGTDGPDGNVLKLRGPLVLTSSDVDGIVAALDDVLHRTAGGAPDG